MNELPLLYEQSPGLQQINLEFAEIESLDPVVPILAQFKDLKELLLFGNRLESLPSDLSKLSKLEKLDISNNLFESIEVILSGLQSLPRLIELNITLQTENDEETLIKSLPKLENLNGSVVDRSKYEHESNEFSPIFNRDISEEISGSAESEKEKLSDDPDEDVGKTLLACESSGYFGEEATLSQEYLEKIANLYDEIRTLWQKEDKTKDKKLAEDFDEGIKGIMEELSEMLKAGHPEFVVSVYSTKAKFELAYICKKKISDLVRAKFSKLGEFLIQTDEIIENLFKDVFSGMKGLYPKIQKKIEGYKAEVQQRASETSEVIEAASEIEKESKSQKNEIETMVKRFYEERKEFIDEIEALKEENKKYLDTIIRHSKSYADSVTRSRSIEEEEEKSFSINISASKQTNGKILSLRQLKEVIEEIYASKAKFDERCAEGKMPRETMEQHMYNYLNTKYGLKNLILD